MWLGVVGRKVYFSLVFDWLKKADLNFDWPTSVIIRIRQWDDVTVNTAAAVLDVFLG